MDSTDVRSSSTAMSETLEYRAISRLSIAALVLGLMSSLALATPVLWIVPIAAMGTASLALRSLAGESNLIGRKASLIGLGLAVLFGTWAPVQLFAMKGIQVYQSREAARQWLDLLRTGQAYEAHQITLKPHRRLRADMTLEEFYGSRVEWRERLERFLERDAVREIADAKDAAIHYLDSPNARGSRWKSWAEHRFELISATGRRLTFRLTVQRIRDKETGEIDWQVFRINDEPFESV